MEYRRTYSAARRTRSAFLTALLVVGAALVVALGYRSLAPSPSAATLWTGDPSPSASSVAAEPLDPPRAAPPQTDRGVSRGGGAFDDGSPAVANLDADLLVALRLAEADAAGDGVRFTVNSGWRSPEHQEQLFREAVAKYGSEAEAARWVAPPATSAHVSGDAVDIGPSGAAEWLSEHGPWYGLCQIYENEPWHFELRPDAAGQGCPPMYADAAHDPRMRR
jgi:D-alanyl-D-alanine carboxypeptidase